jgi:hypothetical protein
MEPKHRDLVTRCRAAQDEFARLVQETDEVAIEVRTFAFARGNVRSAARTAPGAPLQEPALACPSSRRFSARSPAQLRVIL